MEKGIILSVKLNNQEQAVFDDEIEELKSLAIACDIEIIDSVKQNLDYINNQSYIGKGKIEEVKTLCETLEADVVICNDELSSLQISTLQDSLNVSVYDRTYLILEIFKSRARTKEAIIQVEIASLNYMLPRLTGLRKGFSRQRGTGGGFAHGRGAGESKLELDRRAANDRIAVLKQELSELTKVRKQQRIKRIKSEIRTVCLVGYTNSGKSSIMNAILKYSQNSQEEKKVLEKNMLFATLETSSRKIQSKNGSFILTDTVGFIEKLPHTLVEAFKSTLEEISEADLIIHVIDASNPRHELQIKATEDVLLEMGVKDIPIIYVFNKIDQVKEYFYISNDYPNAIRTSATKDININVLIDNILNNIYDDYQEITYVIPYGEEKYLYKIMENSINTVVKYEEKQILLTCLSSEQTVNKFKKYIMVE